MEQLAQVRIAAWQGGSLWRLRTSLPEGSGSGHTGFHAHHAVQIVVGLGGSFTLWLADRELSAPAAAVAPDAPHRFDASGDYAIIFVEPESRPGRAIIAKTFQDGDLCELPAVRRGLIQALAATPWPSSETLADLGRILVEELAGDGPAPIDPRVQDIARWVAASHGGTASLAAAASRACLSPSRLSHLFVEQTGLSFKTYLLWIRLGHAVRLMARGLSLTAVAHEAGFSDSAHLSRTFRRMFGIAPTNLSLV